MTAEMTIGILVAFLTGTGLASLLGVLIKGGKERENIIVASAEKAVTIQGAVVEGLRRELDRLAGINAAHMAEIAALRIENTSLRAQLKAAMA